MKESSRVPRIRRPELRLLRPNPEEELRAIVSVLNDQAIYDDVEDVDVVRSLAALGLVIDRKSEKRALILRQYVEAWIDSGPDLVVFVERNPELWAAVQHQWNSEPPELYPIPSGAIVLWREAKSGRPERDATQLFIALITNSIRHKLGGPCARCRSYYVRRTARNPKVYCSRDCGVRSTAIAATKRQRVADQAKKLQRANRLIQKWNSDPTKEDWKVWVSGQDRDLTKHWLTRAANRGDLKAPLRRI
jgi:hypothetical protein